MKTHVLIVPLLVLFAGAVCAVPFSHTGRVSAVASAGQGTFFSAGDDGFVVKWSGTQCEPYQISTCPIKIVSTSLGGNLVAVYESDGGAVNRVSVWDWTAKKRKFARKFLDKVTSLSFSPKGGYLVVSTLSSSGVVFLMADSGSVLKKLKSPLGSTSYAALSGTEQTMFTYSQRGQAGGKTSGVITYTDMKTGSIKMYKGKGLRFATDDMLEQATLFHNNVFLAGVKGNTVKIIAADSGVAAASFNANNPIILQDSSSADLYYVSKNGGECSLMFVRVEGRGSIGEPQLMAKITLGDERIASGASYAGGAIFATSRGGVYQANIDNAAIALISNDTKSKILDCASYGESFYFLTAKSVIKSSYDNPAVQRIADNDGKTNMTVWDEGIILWSRGALRPVVLLDTSHSNMALDSIGQIKVEVVPKVLFTPKDAINALHVDGGKIIYVSGGRDVKSFDIALGREEDVYSTPSIQDALLSRGALYVAKSAVSSPAAGASALVKVDVVTREATPTKISGALAYSLAGDGTYIYGIKVIRDNTAVKSVMFSYNTATLMSSDLISYASEDTSAFAAIDKNNLITNLGHSSTIVYNTASKRSVTLGRAASLPVTACSTSARTAVAGSDGTVSWYTNGNGKCIATWYMEETGGAAAWKEADEVL